MTTFTVGTFNLRKGRALVRAIAQVIGWQEANTLGVLARITELQGYATFTPAGALDAIPISWRTDVFELVESGSTIVTDDDGDPIGKAEVSPFRGFAWVLLRHRTTGALTYFVNTHFVSAAWSAWRPTTKWRRAFWNRHMAGLTDQVREFLKEPYAVVLVGDMNCGTWLTVPGLHHATAAGRRAPYDQIHTTLPTTHARRGLRYGSDHYSWTAALTLPTPAKEPPVKIAPPNPEYIPAKYVGGSQDEILAIVMHGAVSRDDVGTARGIAKYFQNPPRKTSAHYVRDPRETIQCVHDHTVAYHCGHNTGTIGYELCDEQTGPANRWDDADSRAILAGAAKDVARLCAAYDIEPRRPSIAELKAKGPHGVYGHNDSRLAFGNTTHTDPRDFPWASFMQMVVKEYALLTGTAPKPAPTIRKTPLITAFLAAKTNAERRELAQTIIDGPNEPAGAQATAWLKANSQAAAAKAALKKMEVE
jgi:hypothetical protein